MSVAAREPRGWLGRHALRPAARGAAPGVRRTGRRRRSSAAKAGCAWTTCGSTRTPRA